MDGVSMEGKKEEDRRLLLKFTTLWKSILACISCMRLSYAARRPLINYYRATNNTYANYNMDTEVFVVCLKILMVVAIFLVGCHAYNKGRYF